ncbi:glycosyltransferase [Flexivirga sp. ID2601S]|uniref:Glycosyltransferase n=1 Tax=Flexivirga aerilata TaxID=1656889 RepID=A0A849ADM9_9MICO|nr:glycosyltransferase [Flexivirga aerilata]NNG38559.1 glycosyltransferase [Flexivirga aerilata]
MGVRVSVCIPTYQGGRFLDETLRSVLAQDADDLEVVVRDNASTDETAQVLAAHDDPRLRVITAAETVDLPTNWRLAVEATTGDYVKLVCADDLIAHGAIRRQAAVLSARPEVSVVAARRALIDSQSRILLRHMGLRGLLGVHPGGRVARTIVRRGGINPIGEPCGVMFRRADYDAVGGWDGSRVHPMDVDLWLRLLRRGDLFGQPDELAAFRTSESAYSTAHSKDQYAEYVGFSRRVATGWQVPLRERAAGAVIRRATWEAWPLRQRSITPGDRWPSGPPSH